MDYYEELGLQRNATVQEIRRAYKVLARLVHPDGQSNQSVRDMAERQMKRLNQILATLIDEKARREYDAGLENASHSLVPVAVADLRWQRIDPRMACLPGWLRPVARNWFWISLALVVIGVGTWYLAQVRADNRSPAAKVPVEDKASAVVARRMPARQTKAARHPADARRARRIEAPPRARPADSKPPAPAKTMPSPREASGEEVHVAAKPLENRARERIEVPVPAPPPVSPPQAGNPAGAPAASPRISPFAGNWLYVPDPNEGNRPGLYPAKFVELLLGEEHGRLHGTYRAEYRILDRAVSPDVAFELEGDVPPGIAAHLKWTAADGAKGDVDLALAGPNMMRITWWTTEFGRHAKLASGTSRLIREQVR